MDDSIAFDTNMLAKPTPRRLMTLWLEQANCRTLVLPRVYDELTAPSLAQRDKRYSDKRYKGRNIQSEKWDQAIRSPDSPFLLVEMSEDQKDAAAEFLMRFNGPVGAAASRRRTRALPAQRRRQGRRPVTRSSEKFGRRS